MCVIFSGCTKDKFSPEKSSDATPFSINTRNEATTVIHGNGAAEQPTILGAQRANPYTVELMTRAWNNLYDADVVQLPATHLYLKFTPEDYEALKRLADADLELSDYPLEYEVLHEGTHFEDPQVPEGEIPPFYGMIKVGESIPEVTHELISELVLPPYESLLTAEAFRLTGNDYYYSKGDSIVHGGRNPTEYCLQCCVNYPHCLTNPELGCGASPPLPSSNEECQICCPNYPECLTDGSGCGLPGSFFEDPPSETTDPPVTDPIIIPCEPGSENWPACLGDEEFDDPPGGTIPTSTTTSDCGCEVYADVRKPGGCVQVFDNALEELLPVRNVEVTVRDDWFTSHTTKTDDNGCFKVNDRYYGTVKVKVKFRSDRLIIRGVKGIRYWQYPGPIVDKNKFDGANYNNINIQYWPELDDGANNRMYWYAAHANNALHEYYDFAAEDGIAPPPARLSIFLHNSSGSASAPMFEQMQQNPVGVAGTTSALALLLGITLPTPAGPFAAYIAAYPPDVAYAYGDEGNRGSDQIKGTFFEEYGHAAHYAGLQDDGYWLQVVTYILNNHINLTNPSYGFPGLPGWERCAIVEAWGSAISAIYADRRYGLEHTNSPIGATPADILIDRHIFELERFSPVSAIGSSNENDPLDAWIPEGLFLDCIDDNAQNPINAVDFVNDPIMGFTISDCFESILGSPQAVQEVNDELLERLLAGQLPADLNLLFQEYGY